MIHSASKTQRHGGVSVLNPPSTKKMPALEPLHQRLGRRQTDQRGRVEALSRSGVGRAGLDVPAGRCVDGENGHLGVAQGLDDLGKGLAHLAAEAEAEDGIDDVVGRAERRVKVVGEGHFQVLELLPQALVQLVLALLGVVDGGLVAVVVEVAGRYKTITPCTLLVGVLWSKLDVEVVPLLPGPQATRIRLPWLRG